MTHPVVLDDECRLCVVFVIRKLNPDAWSPPASTLLQAPEVGGLQQCTDRVVHQLLQATLDTLLEQGLDLQAQAQVGMALSSYFKLHAVCCAAMQAAAGPQHAQQVGVPNCLCPPSTYILLSCGWLGCNADALLPLQLCRRGLHQLKLAVPLRQTILQRAPSDGVAAAAVEQQPLARWCAEGRHCPVHDSAVGLRCVQDVLIFLQRLCLSAEDPDAATRHLQAASHRPGWSSNGNAARISPSMQLQRCEPPGSNL